MHITIHAVIPMGCCSYLHDKEINVLFEEVIHLLLKDGLNLSLTVTLCITWSLRDAPSDQCVTLIGYLPGQVTGCFIDLGTLGQRQTDWSDVKIILIRYSKQDEGVTGFFPDSDVGDIAADLQLILTAVEGERLKHISSGPQELPVQLPH